MTKYPLAACLVLLIAACSGNPPEAGSLSAAKPTAPPGAPTAPVASLPERLTPTAVPEAQVPAAQRLPGKLAEAWRWQDANGENLLVVYLTNEKPDHPLNPADAPDDGADERQRQLTARQYVRQPGQPYAELWHLRDEERHCSFSLELALRPHSTTVTDLDHDGQTETTLLYTQGCRSDVSPDGLKLIMHEGAAKYALRGYTVVQFDAVPARQRQPAQPCCLGKLSEQQLDKMYEDPKASYAGRYFIETDFQAKPEFLRFARQQWQQFSMADGLQTE